jgi:hypothetical protein
MPSNAVYRRRLTSFGKDTRRQPLAADNLNGKTTTMKWKTMEAFVDERKEREISIALGRSSKVGA